VKPEKHFEAAELVLLMIHLESSPVSASQIAEAARKPYKEAVLAQLHEGHQGIVRTKSLTCMYVWWPGISEDIEKLVKSCSSCQLNQSAPPVAPLRPWSWPTRPWARFHIDYAGPVEGKVILVLIV